MPAHGNKDTIVHVTLYRKNSKGKKRFVFYVTDDEERMLNDNKTFSSKSREIEIKD